MPITTTLSLAAALMGPAIAFQDIDAVVPCVDGGATVYLCYGEHADCVIDFAGDQDRFQFLGAAGDEIQIRVAGRSNNLDPLIRIFSSISGLVDLSGTTSTCSAPSNTTCVFVAEVTLPDAASYVILLEDDGNTNGGNYTIHLENSLPDYAVPNLDYGMPPERVSLLQQMDVDWLRFQGAVNTDVRIAVNGRNNNLDPRTIVYRPDGVILAQSECSSPSNTTCNYVMDLVALPMDGTYWVRVEDVGGTNGGGIDVSLQCTGFLPCPSPSLDGPLGSTFCVANPNSTGAPALMSGVGSPWISDDRVYLTAAPAPAGAFGLFFAGMVQRAPITIPGSQGLVCINDPLWRLRVVQSCADGEFRERIHLNALPTGMVVMPGDTWTFQCWFRDGGTSNTSDGVEILFQ